MEDPKITAEIRRAVDSGKVLFGKKQSERSALLGKSVLLVVAESMSLEEKEKITLQAKVGQILLYNYDGTGQELGSVCGMPFVVSVLSVENEGKSKVVNAVKKKISQVAK